MRQIPEYPDYVISENGDVYRTVFRNRNCAKVIEPKIVKQWHGWHGYKRVGLSKDGKTTFKYIHRLILETYVGPCPDGYEASHLDGVRTNNSLSNLEWATRKQNHAMKLIHGTAQKGEKCPSRKLNNTKVLEIRQALSDGIKLSILSQLYDVCEATISSIRVGKTWSHI